MKYELIVPELIFEKIHAASLYYEEKQEGLGYKLILDWEESSELITKEPLSFQKIKNNYRQILLTKFSYLIIYRIYNNEVVVYEFINAKKHPSKRFKK